MNFASVSIPADDLYLTPTLSLDEIAKNINEGIR